VSARDTQSGEREPTQDELLAMAYVDGELDAAARGEFEGRMAAHDDLRREVVRLKRLEVLARRAAGPEPMDHEWQRLARDPLHNAGLGLGFTLLVGGAALLAACGLWWLWLSAIEMPFKLGLSAVVAGLALLFLITLRARLRTKPYDPYTEIQR
jgi:anti-sigma factor RsiW